MALTPGMRLGPFEVISAIGAGGMGEVYKARDTRLERTVALKVLPATLADDPEFRARFEREAKTISALNHPNICTLYDVGTAEAPVSAPAAGATPRSRELAYLVLEHLEGETLSARLIKGPLPSDQALDYAMQIVDALDKAHRQGIVHRDLKPANVFLVKGGSASGPGVCKLLDFGLAKIGAVATPGTIETRLVTHATQPQQSTPLTAQGSILGTFQYMAPEQIEGHEADARTDIWGFGCVLYEMLTGRRAFEGKSQASLIASILERQPTPITELQPLAPPALGRIVRTCLEKHPDNRFHTAHDLRLHLQWIEDGGSAAGVPAPVIASRKRRERTLRIGVAAATLLLGAAGAWLLKPAPVVSTVSERFSFPLPEGQNFTRTGRSYLAISPDGRRMAYIANRQIHLREMHQLVSQPISGTNEDPLDLVFSPDGQWIAYFVPSAAVVQASTASNTFILKKIQIGGGTPVPLCPAGWPFGVSWHDHTIVFGQNTDQFRGVMSVPDTAGTPEPLVTAEKAEQVTQPHLVDGGRLVMFTVRAGSATSWDDADIVVQGPGDSDRAVLIRGGSDGRPIAEDRLIYYRDGTVFGTGFDSRARSIRGGSVPLVSGVQSTSAGSGAGLLSVAHNGTLVFVPGTGVSADAEQRHLVWVDRQGKEEQVPAPLRPWRHPRLSPDGGRIVVEEASQSGSALFSWDLARQVLTRLTPSSDRQASFPLWTDNRSIVYRSTSVDGTVKLMRVDSSGAGAPEPLIDLGNIDSSSGILDSISPDGRKLMLRMTNQQLDVMVLPLDGGDRKLQPVLAGPGSEFNGVLSPDGNWLAYVSQEPSPPGYVFLRPFPDVAANRWQVSSTAGADAAWARSSREVFFLSNSNKMLSVTLQPGPVLGRETELFDATAYLSVLQPGVDYDTAPDGRFLMIKRRNVTTTADARPTLTIVTHWVDEVKARVK